MESKVRFVAPEHDPDSRLAAFPFHVPSPDLEALLSISSSTAEVRDETSHSKMVMFAPKQWTIGILLLSFLSIDLLIGKTSPRLSPSDSCPDLCSVSCDLCSHVMDQEEHSEQNHPK